MFVSIALEANRSTFKCILSVRIKLEVSATSEGMFRLQASPPSIELKVNHFIDPSIVPSYGNLRSVGPIDDNLLLKVLDSL